ncbi:MAG: translation initiation factor IF-3 [Bacillales bacterium]|jgi:translation initiation factor IF-3|nr:translation initiation factor IF-3 [Bacillales bacterium]
MPQKKPNFISEELTPKKKVEYDLVNERIRFPSVLLIDETGNNVGLIQTKAAQAYAYSKGLDLYCVNPNGNPVVCKVINYKKMKFDKEKKEKDVRKNQKENDLKEVRIKVNTDIGDLKTWANKMKDWSAKECKVKISLKYKGRELAFPEKGHETIQRLIDLVSEFLTVEKAPIHEGHFLNCFLTPVKKK